VPDAGPDRHDRTPRDRRGRDWATKTSLGDLEVGADGAELYVTNLNDRRIYRFALPTMMLLGSFAHGAHAEEWAEEARPFGLGYRSGRLFHGVTRTGEASHRRGMLEALIYSSLASGADMHLEARFPLDYRRGTFGFDRSQPDTSLDWRPWREGDNDSAPANWYASMYPMPIVSDIAFSESGLMLVGLRDRHGDMTLVSASLMEGTKIGFGVGDILAGVPGGVAGGWTFEPDVEFFEDGTSFGDESALGGLAEIQGPDRIVSSAVGLPSPAFDAWPRRGAYWYGAASGSKSSEELIGSLARPRPRPLMSLAGWRKPRDDEQAWELNLGDVEALCSPAKPSPTPTGTAVPSPSTTASPVPATATATAPATPTPVPEPVYLPVTLNERPCSETRRAAVALVIDTSSSMLEATRSGATKLAAATSAASVFVDLLALPQDQAAVIGFDSTVSAHQLTSDAGDLRAQLADLRSHKGTRIHLGVEAAHAELMSPRRRPENYPAMVVLTDGRATDGPAPGISAARAAKGDGIYIFTIGLGETIDRAQLRAMASDPGAYYEAASVEHLAAVYSAIAVDLPCPPERYWGGR